MFTNLKKKDAGGDLMRDIGGHLKVEEGTGM
jgi:hypothetical protein